jgi:RNA polymerase sigma factor (sigma-70 family)
VHESLDPATLDGFRAGDPDAVRIVYRHYGRLVFAVALRVLGDRQAAEDATQQTFVQAWRAAPGFEAGRDPAPWLATIARRVSIDMLRHANRRPATAIDDADATNGALITLPPSEESIWESWQVRVAIDELDPGERDVVRLQHLQGHSHAEIADRLDLPIGTVKSRSSRAHARLATRLAHLRAGDGDTPSRRRGADG